MPIASFAPTASVSMPVTSVSTNVLIPTTGAPTVALVSNASYQTVTILMGTSAAVAVVAGAGLPIMPSSQIALTIGANTYIAAVCSYGYADVNITVGN